MKTNKLIIAILVMTSTIAGCSKSNSTSGSGSTPPPSTSANDISISGMSFPASITVKVGSTVTWTNADYMTHTVTSDNNSFSSSNMSYGDKFSFTFTTAGTFGYHCKYHSGMTGSIVVQ